MWTTVSQEKEFLISYKIVSWTLRQSVGPNYFTVLGGKNVFFAAKPPNEANI